MISDDFDKNYKVNVSHATMDYLFQSIRASDKEIERLNNNIDKAREYIEENEYSFIDKHGNIQDITQFLEILEGE
jgi:hypothetical protein